MPTRIITLKSKSLPVLSEEERTNQKIEGAAVTVGSITGLVVGAKRMGFWGGVAGLLIGGPLGLLAAIPVKLGLKKAS